MNYRNDIEGLRSIAVLSVVLFHFGVDSLSGGYAGVDVFFVISGFLITSLLIRDIETQRFCLRTFFEKRVRRLFPALFVVILFSALIAYNLFMPEEFKEFGQSLMASVTYLSNVFFWLKSDYFTGPSELKPLLHTWSLAVEEQFYLVFPLIVMLSFKRSKKFFLILVVTLICLSFLASVIMIGATPSAVFYLSPFRFWELLLGSLVAILISLYNRPSGKIANIGLFLGMASVILSIIFLDKQSEFPGWAALPICLGTAVVIWVNRPDTLLTKILASRLMVFTGKISYSMYLWHWPIVVFYGYFLIRELVWWDTIVLLLVTYLISWISWKYIESPFRANKKNILMPIRTFSVTALSTSLVVFIGVAIWKLEGLPNRFPGMKQQVTLAMENRKATKNDCFVKQDEYFDTWSEKECSFSQQGSERTILLWGDSHAYHLLRGLLYFQNDINVNILVYASAGCVPFLHVDIPKNPQCRANNDHVLNLLKDIEVDQIVMAGNWAWAFKEENDDIDLGPLLQTYQEIKNLGYKVTVVNQVPIYPINNPFYLGMRLSSALDGPKDYFIAPDYGVVAEQNIRGLVPPDELFNPYDYLCKNGKCQIYKNRELMVSDNAHYSTIASIEIVGELRKYLAK